jgi:dUTP pyrophosphatase
MLSHSFWDVVRCCPHLHLSHKIKLAETFQHPHSSTITILPFILSSSRRRSAPLLYLFFSTMTNSNQSDILRVKRLSDRAVLPTRGSEFSAGYDLSSAETKVLAAGQRTIVKTDLSIACPPGTYGRVAPRSGLTVKFGIHVGAGVVDADYRGPLGVVLFNLGDKDFEIKEGDRIAQLILEEIKMVPLVDVGEAELDATERGAGGFGSTGTGVEATSSEEEAKKRARTISPKSLPDPPTTQDN